MDVPYLELDEASNSSYPINVAELHVVPTELRQNVGYIQVECYSSLKTVRTCWVSTSSS